jgi:hypothetical protein
MASKERDGIMVNLQDAKYWKAFNAGQEHERKVAIHYFIDKIEDLRQVEGIGETLFKRIVKHVNEEWNK